MFCLRAVSRSICLVAFLSKKLDKKMLRAGKIRFLPVVWELVSLLVHSSLVVVWRFLAPKLVKPTTTWGIIVHFPPQLTKHLLHWLGTTGLYRRTSYDRPQFIWSLLRGQKQFFSHSSPDVNAPLANLCPVPSYSTYK